MKLKYLHLTIPIIFICLNLGAQDSDSVASLKPYEDIESGLFISKVVDMPKKNQKELVTHFKNWASVNFVNLKEVIVSETENQIVINYLVKTASYISTIGVKSFIDIGWYVRMVVQFKDGKLRAQFYDDGNAFVPGEYNRYGSSPSISARSLYVRKYLKKPKTQKFLHRIPNKEHDGPYYDLHIQWQNRVLTMAQSFENGMKEEATYNKQDDFK